MTQGSGTQSNPREPERSCRRPIANFVSRELGLVAGLDTRALARLDSIASAAYSELTSALPELVWSPVWSAAVPFEQVLKRVSRTPSAYPERLETILGERDSWFGGTDPRVADFFVLEGLLAWCAILGDPYAQAIARLPKLSAWWRRVHDRIDVRAIAKQPFTASPFEAELFARARDYVQTHGSPWPL